MPTERKKRKSKKVLVTIPQIVYDLLDMKSAKYGRKVTGVIRDLIIKEIEGDEELYQEYLKRKKGSDTPSQSKGD
jgi:predicted DNA-binding protein